MVPGLFSVLQTQQRRAGKEEEPGPYVLYSAGLGSPPSGRQCHGKTDRVLVCWCSGVAETLLAWRVLEYLPYFIRNLLRRAPGLYRSGEKDNF